MKKICATFLVILLLMTLSACGSENEQLSHEQAQLQETQTEAEGDLEELQAELYVLQAEIEALREQTEQESAEPEPDANVTTETELTSTELDALRQELIMRFTPPNPPPTGVFPIGRWYSTFAEGNVPNQTGGYVMHEFHPDGTVRTYERNWGSSDEGFLYERAWTIDNNTINHGTWTQEETIITIFHPDGTTRRFQAFLSGNEDVLTRINDEGQLFSGNRANFFSDVPPTPGWFYTQRENVPITSLSGNWYYSDTIWPPPLDDPMFFVSYELGESGRLLAHYHVDWRNVTGLTRTGTGRGSYSSVVGRWSFSGNAVHMHFDSGAVVSFTLQSNGELHSANSILQRELIGADWDAHEREVAQQAALMREIQRRFLGQWHFDASLWIFNEDGTGIVDIPHIGVNPQAYLHFTFEVMQASAGYDAMLIMYFSDDWSETLANTSMMYWVNFGTRSGGSMELGGGGREPILLTRMFDINNTPFFDHQLDTFMGLMDMIGNFVP